jgi:hypothetical protein
MKTYVAKMSVTYTEEWVVEAETEAEARTLLHGLDDSVIVDDCGGEITDWQVDSVKVEA